MFWAYLLLIYVCIDAAAEFKKKERKKSLRKTWPFPETPEATHSWWADSNKLSNYVYNSFLTFPACSNPNLNSIFSNFFDMRNLQEQVKKAFCYQKLF